MRQERLSNYVQTTLDGGIDASTTTVVVAEGSIFPEEGDFRIIIDAELMLITARTDNSLTVVRGQEGTSGVTHSHAAIIRTILTAGSLKQYWSDFNSLYIPDSTPPKRIFNASGVPISSSSFTWYNQGAATADDLDDGSILLTTPSSVTHNWRGKYVTAPATPWTLTAAFAVQWIQAAGGAGSTPQCGITVENSVDGKMTSLEYLSGSWYAPGIRFANWDSYTSLNSTHFANLAATQSNMLWLRYTDTGTFHWTYASIDGVKWFFLKEVNRTGWLSNGGDRIGFGHNPNGDTSAGLPYKTFLKHWSWS